MNDPNACQAEATSETTKLKHLDYIQSLVTRMANSSAQSKSWLLPVVTAAFGYALTQESRSIAILGIAATLLFCYLDACYLRQERAYRRLYNAVVAGKEVPELSLDPHDVDKNIPDADGDSSQRNKKARLLKKLCNSVRSWFFIDPGVWFSWSIFPFYGGFFAVGVGVFWYLVSQGSSEMLPEG